MEFKKFRQSILVVDDDEVDRLMMVRAFKDAGVDVDVDIVLAGSGQEALVKLITLAEDTSKDAGRLPSIILLDLNMPQLSGLEVLTELRRSKNSLISCIPVITFTSSAADEDVNNSYSRGCSSFVVKPLDYRSLVEQLRQIHSYWFNLTKLPLGG